MRTVNLDDIDFNYINLDHRTDRKHHIEKQCASIGVVPKRFEAITAEEAKDIEYGGKCVGVHKATPSRKACYASHCQVIRNHQGDRVLGVLEDDAVFCPDFLSRYEYLHDKFPDDWDIFFLNAHFHLHPRFHEKDFEVTSTKHIARVYGLFCAHSYLINPASIPKILEELDRVAPVSYGMDYSYILASKAIKQYCFVPGMTTQLTGHSDIDRYNPRNGLKDTTKTFREACGPHVYTEKLADYNWSQLSEPMSKPSLTRHGLVCPFVNFWAYFPSYFGQLYRKKDIDHLDGSYSAIINYVRSMPGSPTILDVGANSGLVSIPLSMMGYDVIAVEPVAINLECLRKSIEDNDIDSITVVPAALALSAGTRTIYVPQAEDNSSFDAETATANMPNKTILHSEEVACLTLDALAAEHSLVNKSVFLKIDVQGFEHEVLFGGVSYLENTKSCHILFETDDTLPQQVPLADIIAFLTEKGFVQAAGPWNKDLLFIKTAGQ